MRLRRSRPIAPSLIRALLLLPQLLLAATPSDARSGKFRCTRGTTISFSNRSSTATGCDGVAGDECAYSCNDGYLAIGRHVCQSYSTMGEAVIAQAFFGGRCDRLCGPASGWACANDLVPVRLNASDATGPCLTTTCVSKGTALERLARGNYEVWRRGRHNRTGMYTDHVNPLLGHDDQEWVQASADGAGPGLATECVAAALGYITMESAAQRILLTLRSFAGQTPGFRDPRNANGWLPTFMNADTGVCLFGDQNVGCEYSTDSTAFNAVGILFAKTFFELRAPSAATTQEISSLATQLYEEVHWAELFCSVPSMTYGPGTVTKHGPWIPWLYNATSGCRDSFRPAPDGLYYYSEMHWLVWLAHERACGNASHPCNATDPIEEMWRAWEGRADAPNYHYAGHALLTLWPSYVLQLPYYLVGAFNSDRRFTDLFAQQWQAEWAYFNSSSYYAGEDGRYGTGAGPTAEWCAGVGYKADLISNDTSSQTCRIYSPYAVAGYLPAAPGVITEHLLHLLAAGEAVLPVAGTEYFVLWRKSLLDPGWSPIPKPGAGDAGYGITLVDFAAELFGLSTLWLGAEFYQQNTNHWPAKTN